MNQGTDIDDNIIELLTRAGHSVPTVEIIKAIPEWRPTTVRKHLWNLRKAGKIARAVNFTTDQRMTHYMAVKA